jgi:hypothetical protein
MLLGGIIGGVVSSAIVTMSTATAKDIVPIKRGFYVQTDTKCEEASSAVLELFLGNVFRQNCRVKGVRRTGNNAYRITQACIEKGRPFTDTVTYRIISRTEFVVIDADGRERRFR